MLLARDFLETWHGLAKSTLVLESILCAFYLALDACFSCVLSCISLPLAAGSLLFSGLSRLGRLGPRKLEKAASQSPLEGAPLAEPNIEAAKPQGLVQDQFRICSNPSGSQCSGSLGMVKLNIYDVSHESSIQNLNVFLAHPLSPFKFGGVFHAGVEIGGEEWSFGYAPSGSGLHCSLPREHPQHNFRETLELGPTTMTKAEVAALLETMLDEYPGSSYHLIRCNCNHFASDFLKRLGVGELPAWVERLACGLPPCQLFPSMRRAGVGSFVGHMLQ
ncbi:unnamed protein product [Cladocopium goreaui]|uniref:Deubiquitinase DESI2 (Desumoylating isopeptidas e 2) (DeSI-2) (PPPDE peptidase domain-containing protein 1) (Palmitoyl protein thioesterase DESI2) (Protein FAM152A ) (S-depalmitoylase DESI2) n=1 Tax=Cladocopium goreaui TaxID=2562237 RepID=A0A9P1DUH0_9DINO|nr:unnamed protein product [Cladocopium goreaui]